MVTWIALHLVTFSCEGLWVRKGLDQRLGWKRREEMWRQGEREMDRCWKENRFVKLVVREGELEREIFK